MKLFYRSKPSPLKEKLFMVLVCMAEIFDCLVYILSFTYFTSDVRIWLLFDVWPDVKS